MIRRSPFLRKRYRILDSPTGPPCFWFSGERNLEGPPGPSTPAGGGHSVRNSRNAPLGSRCSFAHWASASLHPPQAALRLRPPDPSERRLGARLVCSVPECIVARRAPGKLYLPPKSRVTGAVGNPLAPLRCELLSSFGFVADRCFTDQCPRAYPLSS